MITMYYVGTTPVSNVVSILVTNIFSTLAVNISKILVIYFYYQIHVLRLKTFFKEDYTERLFVRINRKSESYFSIISFQSEANKVYVSEINIVVFKRRN